VLEVMYVDGDRYEHRESNWYWVQLPGDAYGSKVAGWVRGDKVEHAPAPPAPPASTAARAASLPAAGASREPSVSVTTVPARPADDGAVGRSTAARPTRAVVSDVIVNFEFGKADLTEEAKRKLAEAVVAPAAGVQAVSVAVEGHADWVGGASFNERLGLARAESVRRYLSEHFRIPADRIDVVSFGESNPVASNATREGRASNRRAVIKGGA
jgi:outer membrane protein OmpA-like peptidoglycan-associated protein